MPRPIRTGEASPRRGQPARRAARPPATPLVTSPPDADEMLSADAAVALGQTRAAIRRAIQSGALPAVRRPLPGRPSAWAYWLRADDVARHKRYLDLRPYPVGRPKRDA